MEIRIRVWGLFGDERQVENVGSPASPLVKDAGSMHRLPARWGIRRNQLPPPRIAPQPGGCLQAVRDPHIPEGGMSCPGALLCSKDFCCNSGFSQSQPGKFELTVPNAAPACLLMLIVKPWQKHSPSGLQKSCRIRCLPTRWALLRDVTPLTTPDSSLTSFPAPLRARQQPESREPRGGEGPLFPRPPRGHGAGALPRHGLLHPRFAWCSSPALLLPPPFSCWRHPAAQRTVTRSVGRFGLQMIHWYLCTRGFFHVFH